MTLQKIILKVLESKNDWVRSYDLEKVSTPWGWIGSSGSRRARELAKEGEIEHRITSGYAEYRAKPKFAPVIIHHADRVEMIEYRPKVEVKQESLF